MKYHEYFLTVYFSRDHDFNEMPVPNVCLCFVERDGLNFLSALRAFLKLIDQEHQPEKH
jgi:hypothetical protein